MAILSKTPLPIIISGTGPAALLLAHALVNATPPLPFRLYERDLSMTYRAQGYRFVVRGRGVQSCREVLSPEHFALLRNTCADDHSMAPRRMDASTGALLPSPWRPSAKGPSGKEAFRKGSSDQTDEEPLTIDRTVMRQVLFKGLEDYTAFGKEIVGYEDIVVDRDTLLASDDAPAASGNGDSTGVHVRFADGSIVHGSLLVGADGSFSRTRARLAPQLQVLDSEMRMIFGKTPLTPAFYASLGTSGDEDPHTAELLASLTLLADPAPRQSPMFFMFEQMRFGRRHDAAAADSDLAAVIPDDYVYWALSLRSDEPETEGVDWHSIDSSAAADFAENLAKLWMPSLRAIVTHQDRAQTVPLRSPVTPTPLLNWRDASASTTASNGVNGVNGSDPLKPSHGHQSTPAHSPMVTLIGDAAHAMPPTGGLGATTALTDAAVLGAALAAHGVSRRALEVYEAEMRKYADSAIKKSLQGGKMFVNMRDQEEMKPMER